MRRKPIAAIALLAIATIATATDGSSVTLKRVVKKGDMAKYQLQMTMSFAGQDVDISWIGLIEVTSVASNGSFTVRATRKNTRAMRGGVEIPEFRVNDEMVAETTYSPSGEIMDTDADILDPNAYRNGSLSSFMWPTKRVRAGRAWTLNTGLSVGSRWTVKTDADSKKGTFDTIYSYKILGRETVHGHDCFKIKFENRETSGGDNWSKGEAWIDVKSGLMVRVEGQTSSSTFASIITTMKYKTELID